MSGSLAIISKPNYFQHRWWLLGTNINFLCHRNDCNVSIKIIDAESSSNNRELDILQHLETDHETQHQGRKYLPRLLDHFYHDGLNGRSLFLVLERLGPNSWFLLHRGLEDGRLDMSHSRELSTQLLLAVDYLHTRGIVHGGKVYLSRDFLLTTLFSWLKLVLDIHVGNVLFRIPDTMQLKSDSRKPNAYNVRRKDGGPLEQGVPRQFVASMTYYREDCQRLTEIQPFEIQLIDFSNSRLLDLVIICAFNTNVS